METIVSRKRLIRNFCELAEIKSPSGQEEKLANHLITRLRKLGLESVIKDSYGNIIAKLKGKGKPLGLCAHMDTVPVAKQAKIIPIIKKGIITSRGKVILGADNKDYITAILETLIVLKKNKISSRPLEIVLTRQEEEISKGAKNLDYSLLSAKECLISDSSDPYGTIILSAPYCEKINVEVEGITGHVKNPEKCVNAIDIALKMISSIPIGRIDEFTTSNIAFISGGLKSKIDEIKFREIFNQSHNNVPDIAIFLGEIRGPKFKQFRKAVTTSKKICLAVGKMNNAKKVSFHSERLADGYFHNTNDLFVKKIASLLKQQNVKPVFIHTIGGSDANILNQKGIKTIVISSAHRDNHSIKERLIIDDLVKLADFILNLVSL